MSAYGHHIPNSTKEYIGSFVVKPLVVGGVAALTSKYALMENRGVNINGQVIPVWAVLGIAETVASVIAESVEDFLLPQVPVFNKLGNVSAVALSVGTNLAAETLALHLLRNGLSGEIGLTELGAVAVVSEVGGTYIYEKLLAPMWK